MNTLAEQVSTQPAVSGPVPLVVPVGLQTFLALDFGLHDPKYVVGGRYRPLSIATFALEYQFFGQNPHISHLNNILLFILTVLLLYITLTKIFKQHVNKNSFFDFPLVAVLLFIAHPVHTEVIANIKGRDEIMTLAGSLASTLFVLRYIDSHKIWNLLIAFVCFFLALLSKENAITFLAIVPLSIYFYKKVKPITYLYSLAPLLVATILFLVIRYLALGDTPPPKQDFISNCLINATFWEKYATNFYALGLYLKLLIFPHPLTLDYYPNHISITNWSNIFVVLSFMAYISLLLYALFNLVRKSIVSYGILFYLITLSIVSNMFFPPTKKL